MRPERGFINRKVAGMQEEIRWRESSIQYTEKKMKEHLAEIMRLSKLHTKKLSKLNAVKAAVEKILPRLMCENKSLKLAGKKS